jgi:Tfp pilus assembly protein PilF
MNARMRWWIGLTAIASLGLAGCESATETTGPRREPVSAPSRGATAHGKTKLDDIPEGGAPEVLPTTHMAAGRFHESQGHYARAAEQYQHVVAMEPKNIEAYNRLGIVLDRLARFKEADEAFSKAIKLAPDRAYLRNNLAFSYIMQFRWKDAERELRAALELQPDFTRARVNLGMVLAQQNRFEEAYRAFEMALPRADAYYNLGLMYQSRRMPAEAARAYKTALEHNPRLVAAQKRLDLLPPDVVQSATILSFESASPSPVEIADESPTVGPRLEVTTQPADTTTLLPSLPALPVSALTPTVFDPLRIVPTTPPEMFDPLRPLALEMPVGEPDVPLSLLTD